jgi:hypothetical protein
MVMANYRVMQVGRHFYVAVLTEAGIFPFINRKFNTVQAAMRFCEQDLERWVSASEGFGHAI